MTIFKVRSCAAAPVNIVAFGVLAVILFFLSMASLARAETGSPWWHLTTQLRPATIMPGSGKDEVQELTVMANAGDVLIEGKGKLAAFAYNANAAVVQDVLEGLYGAGNVAVSEGKADTAELHTYLVTFQGALTEDSLLALTSPGLSKEACNETPSLGECLAGEASVTVATAARPEGRLTARAINLGDAPTSGPITLSAALPPGATLVEEEFEPGKFRAKVEFNPFALTPNHTDFRFFCKVVSQTVTCTLPNGFMVVPYNDLQLQLQLRVKAGPVIEQARAEVSGGGAGPVATVQSLPVGSASPSFAVEHFEVVPETGTGSVDAQAGSHPFELTTSLSLDQSANPIAPPALPRKLSFQLPPGIVGDVLSVPQCSELDFREITSLENHCPPDTIVGAGFVNFDEPKLGEQTWPVPIFNLVPAPGEPARFGFTAGKSPVTIDTAVRTGSDYGVTATVNNVSEAVNFLSEVVSFWGVPDDPAHDETRGYACPTFSSVEFNALHELCPPAPQTTAPFLTNPTSCSTGFTTTVEGESWPFRASPEAEPKSIDLAKENTSYSLEDAFGRPLLITGCDQLPFSPSADAAPDVPSASTATGLKVDIKVPQEASEDADGLASSAVKDITVALPEGVEVNPAGGNGLEACSEGQIGYLPPPVSEAPEHLRFTPTLPEPLEPGTSLGALGFCPNAAKVGTVEIHTPVLKSPLKGAVYIASQNENPFGSLLASYIVAEDHESGVLVKLPGEVRLCKSSGEAIDGMICAAAGQVITTFLNSPQVPFEDASLHFFDERAPLSTPAFCGSYTTNASFVPWSAEAWDEAAQTKSASSSFDIGSGPNGSPCPGSKLPFSASFTGGTTNNNAGAFSPLSTTIGREDGQQSLQSVQLHMPAGLEGLISNVKLCSEAQANEGTCGPESQIGEATVSAGVGGDPVVVPGGKVYITGEYEGAPYGLSITAPVKAGPFDLEHDTSPQDPGQDPACDCYVVRAKIEVNPLTAELTVATNTTGPHAIPQMIDGVPVQIKQVNVTVNREHFVFNPTSCNQLHMTGTIAGGEEASQAFSVPFQATNCALLGFKPSFHVSVTSKISKQDGVGFNTTLSYPAGSLGKMANIAQVKVELPTQLTSRLSTLQRACLVKVFEANPANCPPESIVGHAKVVTPVLPVPLEGPAYFVSHAAEEYPNLTIVLKGYGVTVELVGSTHIAKKTNITTTTFKATPDVPFNTFELTLPAGEFSALTGFGNLCRSKLAMPTEFAAQNGALIDEPTPIEVTGCPTKPEVVSHKLHGKSLTLSVYVPSAGRLELGGRGLRSTSKRAAGRELLTVTVHVSRRGSFNTKVKLTFAPSAGAKQVRSVQLSA
jgi:hypothetical protein